MGYVRKMAGRLISKSFQVLLQKNNISHLPRNYASAAARNRKQNMVVVGKGKSVESVSKSLASKGFLRPNKPYAAPTNVTEKVLAICSSLNISSTGDYKLNTLEEKFKFLDACFKDFKHSVPNSQVHELKTVGDVIRFYEESVSTTVPYDALKKMDLPENLHIQYDYVRFHPETDTKFNGQTAFPKSSTLVTGLKYRGKYEGHEAKRSWP